MKIPDLYMKIPNLYIKIPDLYMKIPNLYRKIPNLYIKIPDLYMKIPNLPREISPLQSVFYPQNERFKKIDASPVVSGREDSRQAANGISARQPIPAVPGHRALRAVFYRQGLFRTRRRTCLMDMLG
jgi:hypothetical protein